MTERLGWFPATIDFAQKLPYSGEFLPTAGITDTAHQASTPSAIRRQGIISYADSPS